MQTQGASTSPPRILKAPRNSGFPFGTDLDFETTKSRLRQTFGGLQVGAREQRRVGKVAPQRSGKLKKGFLDPDSSRSFCLNFLEYLGFNLLRI